ncbi:MAG: transglutaminaseTgpA domain-containing protein [Candidatus Magnetoovum sp. WYHC-5]|nr:transglutaminaseTgpA domain-containing protein [Candidatus Magnetoovum sp. WYHC-5]
MINTKTIKVETILHAITFIIGIIGYLTVAWDIGFIYSVIFIGLTALSVYNTYRKSISFSRWIFNLISLAVIIFSIVRIYREDLVEPTLEALVVLLSIKFLEEKQFRDYMQIYTISLFLLAGSALLTIDIAFVFYFFSLFFLINLSLILLSYQFESPGLALKKHLILQIIYKSTLIPICSIPVAVAIFTVLPRTDYQLLGFLNRGGRATTGFTETIDLGVVSNIQKDNSIIFRAAMKPMPEHMLYWRGIVLDTFDGTSWKARKDNPLLTLQGANLSGQRIQQTIYLEPYENKYLFALDVPVYIYSRKARSSMDFTYSLEKNVENKMKYDALSVIPKDINSTPRHVSSELPDKHIYLQLPANIPQKIKDLVNTLTTGKEKEKEIISALMSYFGNGKFTYSLEKLPISDTPLTDFLFELKYGNCEYFASALAVMLRLSGIPARLVGGYRGGHYNETGKYYMVMQESAHVWVEAYTNDKGWFRLDATPLSSWELISDRSNTLPIKLRILFDTVNYYWGAFVINYDLHKQLALLRKLKSSIKKPSINLSFDKKNLYIITMLIGSSILIFILFKYLMILRKSKEKRVVALFLQRMSSYGYVKQPNEGLEEFISKISDGSLKAYANRFVKEFEGLYYRDVKFTKTHLKHFKKLLQQKNKR